MSCLPFARVLKLVKVYPGRENHFKTSKKNLPGLSISCLLFAGVLKLVECTLVEKIISKLVIKLARFEYLFTFCRSFKTGQSVYHGGEKSFQNL